MMTTADWHWREHPNDDIWSATAPATVPSVAVIEPPSEPNKPCATGRRVPFGFARALAPEPVERDPVLWEGSD